MYRVETQDGDGEWTEVADYPTREKARNVIENIRWRNRHFCASQFRITEVVS
jgi:hypothetical protein